MNKTLQKRLVLALREENINDIKSANKYLNEIFLPNFNSKFMYEARSENDLHLELKSLKKDPYYKLQKNRNINIRGHFYGTVTIFLKKILQKNSKILL